MGFEAGKLRTAELPIPPISADQRQRARLAVAGYARRELTAIRHKECRELLDMLGLLEVKP